MPTRAVFGLRGSRGLGILILNKTLLDRVSTLILITGSCVYIKICNSVFSGNISALFFIKSL